jgi:hypothetical protein
MWCTLGILGKAGTKGLGTKGLSIWAHLFTLSLIHYFTFTV